MGSSVYLCKDRPLLVSKGIPFLAVIWSAIGFQFFKELSFFTAFAFGIGLVLTALNFLLQYWFVSVRRFLNFSVEKNFGDATHVFVCPKKHKGRSGFALISKVDKSFVYHERKFVWNEESKQFEKISFPVSLPFSEYNGSKGLTTEDAQLSMEKFGSNSVELPLPTFLGLYKEHALAPFFVFQIFFVLLWCLDQYWMYAIMTGMLLGLMEALNVWKRLNTIKTLRGMVQSVGSVNIMRNKKWTLEDGSNIVPGDRIEIGSTKKKPSSSSSSSSSSPAKEEFIIPCDCVLVSGSCVVNESSLTGENVALLKDNVSNRSDDDKLNLNSDKVHILYGGTKLLQCNSGSKESPEHGCVAIAIRTGFASSQGKVLRTISFASESVSANSKEALLFILFLLCFAVIAASYVLYHGWYDEEKSRYKLLLECVIILTSVVPPELPIELALAVTASLQALKRIKIFCTEPFRIPMAGKLDICCFDKTGTLTRDDLIFKGCVNAGSGSMELEKQSKNLSDDLLGVIAGCQSLSKVDGYIMGDPLEIASFESTGWKIASDKDFVHSAKKLKVESVMKFHFNASLRRMTTVALFSGHQSRVEYRVCVKGAPEVVETLLSETERNSEHYKKTFRHFANLGYRIIAYATKKVVETEKKVSEMDRSELESDLTFCGFAVFECLLRKDTEKILKTIEDAGMVNVMITGDSELTACAVSEQTGIGRKGSFLILRESQEGKLVWKDKKTDTLVDEFDMKKVKEMRKQHDLCVVGSALDKVGKTEASIPSYFFPSIVVWARCSPVHKETILVGLRNHGCHSLMCGDGTNDVGALKQSHVGVALVYAEEKKEDLSVEQKRQQLLAEKKKQQEKEKKEKEKKEKERKKKKDVLMVDGTADDRNGPEKVTGVRIIDKFLEIQKQQDKVEDGMQMGDASIAAPFTMKGSNIGPVLDIIRQGRCTLVTTMQMYFILALNCLVTAFSLSVLHLQGVRFGDVQMTITALITTGCFFFISRAQPLKSLAPRKPKHRIFSFYFLSR